MREKVFTIMILLNANWCFRIVPTLHPPLPRAGRQQLLIKEVQPSGFLTSLSSKGAHYILYLRGYETIVWKIHTNRFLFVSLIFNHWLVYWLVGSNHLLVSLIFNHFMFLLIWPFCKFVLFESKTWNQNDL